MSRDRGTCGARQPVPAYTTTDQRDSRRIGRYIDTSAGAHGCWTWAGARNAGGYGVTAWRGRTALAHRAMWMLTCGGVPAGLLVLHECDTAACCNPSHLRTGTPADNTRDALRKGRLHVRYSGADVDRVRDLARCGVPTLAIAKVTGISASHVHRIRLGRSRAFG